MKHLIDKSALVAEINKRIIDVPINNIGHQRVWAYNDVKDIIATLEVKEVDIEQLNKLLSWWKEVTTEHSAYKVKEVDFDFIKEVDEWVKENGDTNGFFNVQELAKYFFKLGLKASSNISIEVTSIDEELKENGIDPNSKEAKIIKESYYTAIEKLSAQKGK